MMVVFSGDDEKNANNAIIVRLLKKLELHSVEDQIIETLTIRNLAIERKRQLTESTHKIIDLLNKFKQIVGMEETNILDDPTMPKMPDSCTSLVILDEFLCPITLEIMTYPIIVTSDQVIVRDRGSSNMEQPKAKA